MNTSAPANYVIRIDGHLGEHCSASLGEVTLVCGRRFDTRRRLTGPELLTVRSVCSFRRADKVAL
jgi:hypothetical protein